MISVPTLSAPGRGLSARVNANLVRIASAIVVLSLWQFAGSKVNPLFFAPPTRVVSSFYDLVESGTLPRAFMTSMVGLLIGFAVAAVFGVVIGMLMGRYKKLEMALDSVVNAAYVTPHVAFIPIIILWFGLGLEAKIFIVSTSAIFPVLINTQSGVRDVSKLLVEVGEAFVANPRQIFFKIVIPASLPFIMAGLRLAIGRALTSVIVADFFTAMTGLGGVILQASTLLRVSNMLAAVLVVMIVGVSLTELVKFGEARFAPWKETERATR